MGRIKKEIHTLWNGMTLKEPYIGLGKQSVGVVQFDTAKNRFLAVGDECIVKFWDMDNVNLLATTDAEGELLVSFSYAC